MTYPSPLKIGILGTGHIGKTLTRRLSAAGHQVKVALRVLGSEHECLKQPVVPLLS
ncbi:NAD(P)-binding domain-containing protein [Enterobacter ludwigii]